MERTAMRRDEKFGLYLLANDAVIDWTDAFLRSLRALNPRLTVYHIPFDDRCAQVSRLARNYGCLPFPFPVERYDTIGASFHPDSEVGIHVFRKLAIFAGPLEQFIYIDTDVVVAAPLQPIANRIFASDYDICFYRHDHQDRNFADPRLVDFMDIAFPEYGTDKGFNSGFIASRRNAIPFRHIENVARRADKIARLFGAAWGEQPFLNFSAATHGLRAVRLPQLMPELAVNWDCFVDVRRDEATGCYVTGPDSPFRDNEEIHGPGGAVAGKIMPMIHWGGYKRASPDMPNYKLWEQAASAELRRSSRLSVPWFWQHD